MSKAENAPGRNPAPRSQGKLVTGVTLAVLIVSFVGVLSYRNMMNSDSERRWVSHTHLVLEKLDEFFENIGTADAQVRGYNWTGDEKLIASYRASLERSAAQIEEIRTLTADNPTQQKAVSHLQSAVAEFAKGEGRDHTPAPNNKKRRTN